VQVWDLSAIATPGGTVSPVVLHSENEARAVLIGLQAGQELGDHEVKERAWIVVLEGDVEIGSRGETTTAGPRTLVTFAPGERRAVRSLGGARILLVLAPWPGEGHYRGGDSPRVASRPASG
jgi:quercetin dioxygenase-like cupin family protein